MGRRQVPSASKPLSLGDIKRSRPLRHGEVRNRNEDKKSPDEGFPVKAGALYDVTPTSEPGSDFDTLKARLEQGESGRSDLPPVEVRIRRYCHVVKMSATEVAGTTKILIESFELTFYRLFFLCWLLAQKF